MTLQGIQVTFTNGSSTYQFKNVKSVTWADAFDKKLLVDSTTEVGYLVKTITIQGFIIVPIGIQNTAAQQTLEDSLKNIGSGTLTYTGVTNIQNVRLSSLSFEAYRGNPVCQFTIIFETNSDNPHSQSTVVINGITLDPTPSVVDSIKSQSQHQGLNNLKSRFFKISGRFKGNQSQVAISYANLVAAVQTSQNQTLVITVGADSFTVVPDSLEFESPEIDDTGASRRYTFACSTYENYLIEPYSFGESAYTFGAIVLDVLESIKHDSKIEHTTSPNLFYIIEESISISGKKYFSDYASYETARQALREIPSSTSAAIQNSFSVQSQNQNYLFLEDVSVSDFKRDGNNPVDNSFRYSAKLSLVWRWRKSLNVTTFNTNSTILGILWHDVKSVSFNSSVDDHGVVTGKSVNITGRILTDTAYANALAKLGTKVDYDTNLKDLYLTSINASSVDEISSGGTKAKVYSVSVSANQLSTPAQYSYFLSAQFAVLKTDTTQFTNSPIIFSSVTSRSKSISNRFDSLLQKFKVTSISLSITGEVHQVDSGSGAPSAPSQVVALFDAINAEIEVGIEADRVNQANWKYFISNISVGNWESFIHPILKTLYWRQSVTVNANVTFDLASSGGGSEPDYIDTTSFIWDKDAPKFVTLQVLGYGTVFKKIGVEPQRATINAERTYSSKSLYQANGFPTAPSLNILIPQFPSTNMKIKETRESRGLTNRITQEWLQTGT